jgi:hypothetical protein
MPTSTGKLRNMPGPAAAEGGVTAAGPEGWGRTARVYADESTRGYASALGPPRRAERDDEPEPGGYRPR